MAKRTLVVLLVFGLIAATPARAFFEVFDALKEKLQTIGGGSSSSAGTTGIEGLLEELKEVTGPRFTDVPENAWFADTVLSIAKWKIADGYKNAKGERTGLFGPGDPVTVAQILKMALKAAKIDEKRCTGIAGHPEASGHWAYAYVVCAEEMGFRLFEDQPPASLNRPALRAEVVSIIHDAFQDDVPDFTSAFKDTIGHRFETDIAFANFQGVVTGDRDAKGRPLWLFRPNDPVNRAEAAKIIYEKIRSVVMAEKEGDTVTINMTVKDFSFTPKNMTVRRGQFVTIRFRNTGRHTFTVPGLLNKLLPFQTDSVSFIAEKTGVYPFQCAVAGHKEKGMEGSMTIVE